MAPQLTHLSVSAVNKRKDIHTKSDNDNITDLNDNADYNVLHTNKCGRLMLYTVLTLLELTKLL